MRKYSSIVLAWLVGASVWVPGSVSFSATMAYWQLDELAGTSLVDAVGGNDLADTVSIGTSAPFAPVVPNPDTNTFSTGTSQDNPSALVNSHGARVVYDEAFDMRLSPWTLEGWFRNSSPPGEQLGVETYWYGAIRTGQMREAIPAM